MITRLILYMCLLVIPRTVLSVSFRMVGGTLAETHRFPFHATIHMSDERHNIERTARCGGVLINRRWILTAAYCARLPKEAYSYLYIKMGKHNLMINEPYEQRFLVKRIVVHPCYEKYVNVTDSGYGMPFDIALMKVNKDVRYTKSVRPLYLPKVVTIPTGDALFLSFTAKKLRDTTKKEMLQYVKRKVMLFKDCKKTLENFNVSTENLHYSSVCLLGPNRATWDCFGNIGGPLVHHLMTDRYILIGVASWSLQDCGVPRAPTIFTLVSYFITWIRKTLLKYK